MKDNQKEKRENPTCLKTYMIMHDILSFWTRAEEDIVQETKTHDSKSLLKEITSGLHAPDVDVCLNIVN